MAKKRKATDATIRNVRASKRRDESIGARVKKLEERITELERKHGAIVHGLRSGLAQI